MMKHTGFEAILGVTGARRPRLSMLAALVALFSLLGSAVISQAQVSVEVMMDQDQFVSGETVSVSARIINHSGQTLHFGKEEWLSYSVEGRDGFIVVKMGEPPAAHDFDVETSKMATQHADIGPYFNLTRPGRYKVTASVQIKDWGSELTSPPKYFTITKGFKLWEQEFGVPQTSTTNRTQPETRKYILQQATYLKSMKLYLRVTDSTETKAFKVFCVGPMISFSRPQTQLDKANNLHLLYEEGSRTFNYTIVNPDGEITTRQTYYYNEAGPRLQMDDAGKISVAGGVRRVAVTDVPPAGTATSSNDIAPPKL